MMLLGLIWAAFAPLLLVPVGALLVVLLGFTGWSRNVRMVVAAGMVVVVVGTCWWLDYKEFSLVCERVGKPRIIAHAAADGIFLDSPTANSFGMRYVQDQGFAWMEMRSIYDRNNIELVTREADGRIRTEPTDTIKARYEVRETFERPHPHISTNITRVIDRQTGMIMAQAGSVDFDGGRTNWVLGMYGARHFPNVLTHGEDFKTYYNLAQRTLR
jgi:hypothetical protein